MDHKTPLLRAIEIATSQSELARRVDLKQGHISAWLKSGKVPADMVIPVAKAVDWKLTPHQIRSDIYPHPSDGLPKQEAA